jgi:hypothetical protein
VAESHTRRGDGINLTRGEVLAGISEYSKEHQADLLWLHGYAADELGSSRSRLVESLRLDETTITRVWRGKYGASIDKIMERVRLYRRKVELTVRKRFIPTLVTERIMRVCDTARDRQVMVMISGPTGRSKTWAIDEWRHRNNHGRAVYVYAPEVGGFRRFLEEIAKSLNIACSRNNYAVINAIEASLDERNVLVIDEVAHLYPSGRSSSLQSIEFIRGLHDRCGCGVVLCSTDGFPGIIASGRWSQWFDQLLGRIELHLRIPQQFSRQEVAELLGGYMDDPPSDLVLAARQIANKSTRGCRDLFRHLDRAAQVAADCGQPLGAEILQKVFNGAVDLLSIPKD